MEPKETVKMFLKVMAVPIIVIIVVLVLIFTN